MKTSFYFFIWFIVYYLIDLTGSQLLIQNDFFVALILVFFISRLDHSLFSKETQYQTNLNRAYIFEIFYNNDVHQMLKLTRQKMWGQVIWAIYCILTVGGLLALHNDDFVAYTIFGFFGVMSMIASSKLFNQSRELKGNGLPPFDELPYASDEDAYQKYCELRVQYSAQTLLPKAPSISKWVNIASIVFAVACIGGGLFYLLIILLGIGKINMLFSAMLIWAVLAIFFGAKDLWISIKVLQGKPVPSIK